MNTIHLRLSPVLMSSPLPLHNKILQFGHYHCLLSIFVQVIWGHPQAFAFCYQI